MGKGFIGSLALLLAGAGLSMGQPGGPGGPPPGMPPGLGGMPPGGPGGPPPGLMGDPGFMTTDGRPVLPPPGLEGALHPAYLQPGPYQYGAGPGLLEGGGEAPAFWLKGDYLLWMPKSMNIQTLATTSGAAAQGILGLPTTVPLYGQDKLDFGTGSGFRVLSGFAFDESSGFEMGGFWLASRGDEFSRYSNATGSPFLAVPFINNSTGQAGSYIVSNPGAWQGGIRVGSSTQSWGAEGNVVFRLVPVVNNSFGFDILVGLRYLEVKENMSLNTLSTGVPAATGLFGNSYAPLGAGTFAGSAVATFGGGPYTITTTDEVRTYNQFYGGTLGLRTDSTLGRFTMTATGKISAGWMRQRVDVNAGTALGSSTTGTAVPGGVLFSGAEVGSNHVSRFAYIPEGSIDLGYQVTPRLRMHVGYSFMWISSVSRPSSVFTPNANPSLSPASPTFTGSTAGFGGFSRDLKQDSDFWLQGVNFGFAFQF